MSTVTISAQDINKLRQMTGAGHDGLSQSIDRNQWRF
jgi:translation elongation factor EF-Ts